MVKTIKAVKFFPFKLPTQLNKIYILPNNLGIYFIGLWSSCFLLSVGYASNLLLFVAIMQFALFFWWMITAHADSSQLKANKIILNNAHAQDDLQLTIHWNNTNMVENIVGLTLIDEAGKKYIFKVSDKKNWSLKIEHRGFYQFKKLGVTLHSGFWLFKTWKYLPVQLQLYVYPKTLKPDYDFISSSVIADNSDLRKKSSEQPLELDLLKEAQSATRPNRIDWKRFAQRLILVERFGESGVKQQHTLDLDQIKNEEELSFVTFELLNLFKNQATWYLKYKQQHLGPYNILGNSQDDLITCLKKLATFSI